MTDLPVAPVAGATLAAEWTRKRSTRRLKRDLEAARAAAGDGDFTDGFVAHNQGKIQDLELALAVRAAEHHLAGKSNFARLAYMESRIAHALEDWPDPAESEG